MLVEHAIAYLEDESIDASDRFQVLTGFDTKLNTKNRDPNYWFNALYQSKTLEKIEKSKTTSGVFGIFAFMAAAVTGSDLESQLKCAYKKGSTPSTEQIEGQEEYIGIIAAYLIENRMAAIFLNFEFAAPEALVSKQEVPVESKCYI